MGDYTAIKIMLKIYMNIDNVHMQWVFGVF